VFNEYDRTMIAGDSRAKETKKVGGAGARSKEQKVIGRRKEESDYPRKMLHLRQVGWRPMGRIHSAH
jgi:hypothetical protein